MRRGRAEEPTGDLRDDALRELRQAMAGAGLTTEQVAAMHAVPRLPAVAVALAGADARSAPRVAYDVVAAAARGLGDRLDARLLRNALGIDYAGSAKDLTARREEFVGAHNAAARAAGSRRNLLPETSRALLTREDRVLEELVTALGAPPRSAGHLVAGEAPPTVTAAGRPADAAVPRQLPAAPARFNGRAAALAWLDANALGAGSPDGAPAVLAIHGLPGIGKTALAVHWAHDAAAAFPDGQLYVDLRGYSPAGLPATPVAALGALLAGLGVRTDNLPVDADGLAGAYRSATAGRRLLVVLDNAASAEEVAPLIPGEAGCAVVVTSRDALPDLVVAHDARTMRLDPLAPAEAGTLLDALLTTGRTNAERAATDELAALCGYLPLAIRIVAAKLEVERGTTLTSLAQRLRANDRLAGLGFGDGANAVRSAFELSYESLTEAERRAFRLLGPVPSVDVTAPAAAAALDTDEPAARDLLDRLASHSLVATTAPGRYQFHDLLREYAAERCLLVDGAAARAAASDRLLAHLLDRAAAATAVLHPGGLRFPGDRPEPTVPQGGPSDRDGAIAWLSAERQNLSAAVVHAAAHGPATAAWQLAYAMRSYFLVDLSGRDWIPVGEAGLAAATEAGHHAAMSAMHGLLGRAYRQLGDLAAAEDHVERALATSRLAGWAEGEAIAHCTLGSVVEDRGRPDEAITHYEAALALERRDAALGAPGGAGHLRGIAGALFLQGRYAEAAAHLEDALEITARLGDDRGTAHARERLGAVRYEQGRLDEAAADLAFALAEFRRLDFAGLEALCLSTFAPVRHDFGDVAGARADAAESLRLADGIADPRLQSVAWSTLGRLALLAADPAPAADAYARGAALAEVAGYRFGALDAGAGLAAAVAAGDPYRGCDLAAAVVDGAAGAGFAALTARAMVVLGQARLALGDEDGAAAAADRALALYLRCGSPAGIAEAELLRADARRVG